MPAAVRRSTLTLAVALTVTVSCKKAGREASATPESAEPTGAADPLASIERELDDVDARMRAAGLAPVGTRDAKERKLEHEPAPPAPDADDAGGGGGDGKKNREQAPARQTRPTVESPKPVPTEGGDERATDGSAPPHCQPLCDLATTSCDLQTRVCELADDHEGEPRYEEACLRAQDQCRVATEACAACNGAG